MLGIRRAFIQASLETKLPMDETAFAVYQGCRMLDIEPTLYTFTQDIRKELAKDTFVWAGVPFTIAALNILGVKIPEVLDYPPSLSEIFGREIALTTLGDLRQRRSSVPVFVKPAKGTKLFNGFLYQGTIEDQIRLATFEDDLLIWQSEVVEFSSEYRVLVHKSEIVACRHYKGDCWIFPDLGIVADALAEFKDAPCAFSLDVGVTSQGQTLLVEVNDAWALGCYGTPSIPYTEMVINRWKEMVSLP